MAKMSDLVACVWCDEALTDREVSHVDVGPLCGACYMKWRDGWRPEPKPLPPVYHAEEIDRAMEWVAANSYDLVEFPEQREEILAETRAALEASDREEYASNSGKAPRVTVSVKDPNRDFGWPCDLIIGPGGVSVHIPWEPRRIEVWKGTTERDRRLLESVRRREQGRRR